jgi:hypothetical protein
MANPLDHLSRWQAAGLVDAQTVERILAFEQASNAESATESTRERPTVIEAVVYLGLVVIAAGIFFLAGNNWEQLESWARIAFCVVPTLATLAVGAALRRNSQAPLRRGGELAWLVSVALFGVSVAVVLNEFGDHNGDGRTILLVTGCATLASAAALWVIQPRDAQVAAVAGSTMLLLQALGNWPDDFSTELVGVCGFLVAALALSLGEAGFFTPRRAVRVTFGVLAIASTYEASFGSAIGFEFLAFAASLGLLAMGVVRNAFTFVVLGIVGTFLALVTFIFAHFADSIGAPVALIISGALVLLGVMLVVQARNITRTRTLLRGQGR